MAHVANKKGQVRFGNVLLAVFVFVVVIAFFTRATTTQGQTTTLQAVFTQFEQALNRNSEAIVRVEFVTSLTPVERPTYTITLPSPSEDNFRISIDTIGSDYVCFLGDTSESGFAFRDCIPYSNIASVTYTANPQGE